MRNLVALVALAVALAGCGGGDGDGQANPTGDPTPQPEGDTGVFYVEFESEDPATLEVPLPTLDSCRAPEHWMEGEIAMSNATATLGDAADGRTGKVLAITGQGRVEWSSQIPLGPECQTFRYDPWSIDPDPDDGTVEVRVAAGSPAHASLLVRLARDSCITTTLYDGSPGAGWSPLQGRTMPSSCA